MSVRDRRPVSSYGASAELEFRVTDDRCFLIAESGDANCELVLEETVQQSNGNALEFISVYGASATRVLADALKWPEVVDARIVAEDEESSLLELVTTGPSLESTVADTRSVLRLATADHGEGRVVVVVPPYTDPQQVIEVFQERHPGSKLVARREHEFGPQLSDELSRERILGGLTDRQRETLVTAYEMGYFDNPRGTTAVECAESLGISQSTFSQHLSVALNKVLGALLADVRSR